MTEVFIDTPYVMLQQLLKMENIVSSGGQVKWFLQENQVMVNGEHDDRRGRKLYPGDEIAVPDFGSFVIRAHEA
ncbi:S4 domain-containing protein YaaA [Periweissella cryptocerci]|uniref:S4 domain-containing protein YaaA n=1 Tax=Periweissella cryptocerci TaxID=2506420 RepID=A0A4P6YU58_9LACO|nr:S4 domain-containing protein YaaA [Periweissella cryptocerci]QBO36260.1 S4 domain-containing protein YaaA [Periweissella cryptocerci]